MALTLQFRLQGCYPFRKRKQINIVKATYLRGLTALILILIKINEE